MNRYTTNGEEGEILPNLLGITDEETLHNAEFEGFLMAEILFTEKLTPKTKFSVKYICDIHRTALKELYSFAGHFRSVNISKGGFVFPNFSSDDAKELARLKKENRDLKDAVEILKKAMSIVSSQ